MAKLNLPIQALQGIVHQVIDHDRDRFLSVGDTVKDGNRSMTIQSVEKDSLEKELTEVRGKKIKFVFLADPVSPQRTDLYVVYQNLETPKTIDSREKSAFLLNYVQSRRVVYNPLPPWDIDHYVETPDQNVFQDHVALIREIKDLRGYTSDHNNFFVPEFYTKICKDIPEQNQKACYFNAVERFQILQREARKYEKTFTDFEEATGHLASAVYYMGSEEGKSYPNLVEQMLGVLLLSINQYYGARTSFVAAMNQQKK